MLSFAKTRSPLDSTAWKIGCNVVELGYMRTQRGILESEDILTKDFLNKELTAVLGNNFIFRL